MYMHVTTTTTTTQQTITQNHLIHVCLIIVYILFCPLSQCLEHSAKTCCYTGSRKVLFSFLFDAVAIYLLQSVGTTIL